MQFCKKNTKNLWLINGHFRTISGHFLVNCMKIFHKKEVQTVILRWLVCLNLNWIKSYNLVLVKIIFLSCMTMYHFIASLPKWVFRPPKETSSHIFKMVIFPKFFWGPFSGPGRISSCPFCTRQFYHDNGTKSKYGNVERLRHYSANCCSIKKHKRTSDIFCKPSTASTK